MAEGYNPFTGFFLAENICELSNADTSGLQDGALAYVKSVNSYYRYAELGTPTPTDGTYVVSTWSGPLNPGCAPQPSNAHGTDVARWVLTNLADVLGVGANFTAYFIDAVLGNNANDGLTPATAIQTARELGRRWRQGATFNSDYIFVTVLSDHLLSNDVIDIARPSGSSVFNTPASYPIVWFGTRQANLVTGATTLAGTRSQNAAAAGGGDCTMINHAGLGYAALYPNAIVQIVGGANGGAWAYLVAQSGLTATLNYELLSPFVHQTIAPVSAGAVNPDLTLNTLNPAGGETFNVLGRGCLIPDTIILDIPPRSEVWFYDMELQGGAAPVPYTVPNLKSGILRFYRSTGLVTPPIPTKLLTGPGPNVTLYFEGSSTANINIVMTKVASEINVNWFGGLTIQGGVYNSNGGIFVGALHMGQDTILARQSTVIMGVAQEVILTNVCVQKNQAPVVASFLISGGTFTCNGTLYGTENAQTILQLGRYAKGTYTDRTLLTVADTTGNPGASTAKTGVVDYLNSVLKTFANTDVPMVSNATASDSQAGLVNAFGGL